MELMNPLILFHFSFTVKGSVAIIIALSSGDLISLRFTEYWSSIKVTVLNGAFL